MAAELGYATVFIRNYSDTVTKNFKCFLDDDIYIDLVFICKNNEKVGAHQIVMGCISRFFYSMFIENLNTVKEKIMYVYVPDITASIMKRILEFVYCGKAMLSQSELTEFNSNIKLLGMPLDLFTSDNKSTSSQKSSTIVPNIKESTSKKSVKAPYEVLKNATCVPEMLNEPQTNFKGPQQLSANSVMQTNEEIAPLSSNSAILRPTIRSNIKPPSASNTPEVTNVYQIPPLSNISRKVPGMEFSCASVFSDSSPENLTANVKPTNPADSSPTTSELRTTQSLTLKGRPKKRKSDLLSTEVCINLDSDGEDDVITIS